MAVTSDMVTLQRSKLRPGIKGGRRPYSTRSLDCEAGECEFDDREFDMANSAAISMFCRERKCALQSWAVGGAESWSRASGVRTVNDQPTSLMSAAAP